jgi:hypothetical protein
MHPKLRDMVPASWDCAPLGGWSCRRYQSQIRRKHALVAQRVIHVDQRFPIFMAGRIQQSNSAREVLRNISPPVTIVAKLNELNRKRFIEAFGLQHDLIILASGLKTYRPGKARCETPGADVSSALPDR